MKTRVWVFLIAAAGFVLSVYVIQYNQSRGARFTVDVLQRYISAWERVTDRKIFSWDDIPDFDIISPADSLRVRSADLKRNAFRRCGYVYDMRFEEEARYVISASPMGLLSPRVEYGITEQGILKENTRDVDLLPDSRGEVSSWKAIERIENARTRDLPEYLRD